MKKKNNLNSNIQQLFDEQIIAVTSCYTPKRLVVGYSGGVDSHVALYLAKQSADLLSLPIIAIHVNHNLQKISSEWVAHCKRQCALLNIELIVETIQQRPKVGESIEDFARKQRYQLIEKNLLLGDIFISGHHKNDQAETFLLQLMRGAGLDGLKSMPISKKIGDAIYLRALLDISKADISQFAVENNLDYINDPSNLDDDFDRNFIRNQVIPLLETRWQGATKSIATSAKWLAEITELPAPKQLLISELEKLSVIERKSAIRSYIKSKTTFALNQNQLDYILSNFFSAANDKNPILKHYEYIIRRYKEQIIVTESLPVISCDDKCIIVGDNVELFAVGNLSWQSGSGLDVDQFKQLRLGKVNKRDYFHPHYREHSQVIKKLLQERQIPNWLRETCLGLYDDEQRLIAILGIGVAKDFYSAGTNKLLPCWHIRPNFVSI